VRVLISAYDTGSSGISSYTLELAKLLSKDVKISLISFQDIDLPGVDVIPIRRIQESRALPLLTFLRNEKRIREVTKDFDLVHETLPPWGSTTQPMITTRWGYLSYIELAWVRLTGLSFPEKLGAFPVTLQHYLMDRRSRMRARYVIDVSRETPNFIPPPVEPRPQKSYQCSTLRLLFVSRDLGMPRKNLGVVMRALSMVKIPVELHLVGAGRPPGPKPPYPVINHGQLLREEVISLMREVDLLVLPSTYEELGFVGLEAYSVGLPVVTSDIPSFRAVFKASLRFHPKDPVGLADIINSISCNKLEKMGKESREYVIKSNELGRRKILDIYRLVIQR